MEEEENKGWKKRRIKGGEEENKGWKKRRIKGRMRGGRRGE